MTTTSLPEPECSLGYPFSQLQVIFGDRMEDFNGWMYGQTGAICDASPQREWRKNCDNRDVLVDVGPPRCSKPHGLVVYPWDVRRYLAGLPVID